MRIQKEVMTQVRARVVMNNENLGSAVVAVLESATVDSVMSRLGLDRVRPAVTDKTKRVDETPDTKAIAGADKRVKDHELQLEQQKSKSQRLERQSRDWRNQYSDRHDARRYSDRRDRRMPSPRRDLCEPFGRDAEPARGDRRGR